MFLTIVVTTLDSGPTQISLCLVEKIAEEDFVIVCILTLIDCDFNYIIKCNDGGDTRWR